MKRNKKVVRLIVLGILTAVVFIVGYQTDTFGAMLPDADYQWNGGKILSILAMVFTTLLIENLLVLALSFLKPQRHRAKTLVALTSNMLKYAAAIIILCGVLTIVNVDITAILASLGILALIIGFGAESLIADVITGIFMLFEHQYEVGDIIVVGDFRGTVTQIGIRTTSITDTGGNVQIINNSDIRNLINRSNDNSFAVCDIAIPYQGYLHKAEKVLEQTLPTLCTQYPEFFEKQPSYLGVQSMDISNDAVLLRISAEVAEKNIYSGQRALNRTLLLAFEDAGIPNPVAEVKLTRE